MTDDTPLIEPAPLLLRLPIIRHVRTLWHAVHVGRWEKTWRSVGFIATEFDDRVLRQMWRGIV